MFKHILIPTDGSALSRKAIAMGVTLAKETGARITGVFAAPPATPVVYRDFLPVAVVTPEAHAKMIEKTARAYLGVIEKAAKAARVRCQILHETSDFPADLILATAKKQKCDLIVMATHGRRGVKGVLLGSVTQDVLTRATIPVLVTR